MARSGRAGGAKGTRQLPRSDRGRRARPAQLSSGAPDRCLPRCPRRGRLHPRRPCPRLRRRAITQARNDDVAVLVSITAVIAIVPHWPWSARVRFGPGILFGLVGIAGSLLGSRWNDAADPDVLLLAFAGLMLVAATAMRGGGSAGLHRSRRTRRVQRPRPPRPRPRWRRTRSSDLTKVPKVVAAGTVVGLLTGFFGVGGGAFSPSVPGFVLALASPCPKPSERPCSSSRSTPGSHSAPDSNRLYRVAHAHPVHACQPRRRRHRCPARQHQGLDGAAALVRRAPRRRGDLHRDQFGLALL